MKLFSTNNMEITEKHSPSI